MVNDLLKQRGLEQTYNSMERLDVPDDARAVGTGRHCLVVVLSDLNGPDTSSVLLHGRFHDLALLAELEDSHFAFAAAGYHTLTITG